jgi:DNA-binding CsgD family transcriptional regulator
VNGCVRIGSLHDFVQGLDEGSHARSLHHLVGQLHMAAGDESARARWVASVRERFAALQAACFESEFSVVDGDAAITDPPDADAHALALRVLKSALQGVTLGEAVAYSTHSTSEPREGGLCVTGVAVRCGPARGVGFILTRAQDTVSDPDAILQYLAAITWHLRCADVVAARLRVLERRMSAVDLLDVLPLPCVITDAAGRAIERNEAFDEFMESASLRIATGRLRFEDPYLQDSWHLALSEVDTTAVRQTLLVTVQDGRQWCVHLVPLRFALDAQDSTERPMILVLVDAQAAHAAERLDQMAGESMRPLTQAEQEVLDAVLQGHSAKVIATARGASVNTVRSQISAILEKTGHHNQKALMAAFAPSGFRSSSMMSGFSTPIPAFQVAQSGRRPRDTKR